MLLSDFQTILAYGSLSLDRRQTVAVQKARKPSGRCRVVFAACDDITE